MKKQTWVSLFYRELPYHTPLHLNTLHITNFLEINFSLENNKFLGQMTGECPKELEEITWFNYLIVNIKVL